MLFKETSTLEKRRWVLPSIALKKTKSQTIPFCWVTEFDSDIQLLSTLVAKEVFPDPLFWTNANERRYHISLSCHEGGNESCDRSGRKSSWFVTELQGVLNFDPSKQNASQMFPSGLFVYLQNPLVSVNTLKIVLYVRLCLCVCKQLTSFEWVLGWYKDTKIGAHFPLSVMTPWHFVPKSGHLGLDLWAPKCPQTAWRISVNILPLFSPLLGCIISQGMHKGRGVHCFRLLCPGAGSSFIGTTTACPGRLSLAWCRHSEREVSERFGKRSWKHVSGS